MFAAQDGEGVGGGEDCHGGAGFDGCGAEVRDEGYVFQLEEPGVDLGFLFEDVQSGAGEPAAGRIARPENNSRSSVTTAMTSSEPMKATPAIGRGFG